MRIAIMGTPVAPGNRGVMALGASLVDLLHKAAPGARFSFLQLHTPWDDVVVQTADGPLQVAVVTCRLSPRALLRDHLAWILLLSAFYKAVPSLRSTIKKHSPWIYTVAESDLIGDIRGGDSFSDIYGLRRFIIAALPVISVILIRGEIAHFPQTYGPFKSRIARRVARFLLSRSSAIIARDEESQVMANSLVPPTAAVILSPDVAFALHPMRPAMIATRPQSPEGFPEGQIGLNVNALMYNGGYTRRNMFTLQLDYQSFLPKLIETLLCESERDVILVPHTYAAHGDVESDNEACLRVQDQVQSEFRHRVRVLDGEYDQHELKGVIGRCEFFIGSRMHSCIAALSQGIPCVGVAYSMKFRGVFQSVGMADWVVDCRDADESKAIARILNLYKSREHVRAGLKERADEARLHLGKVFRDLTKCR